MVAIDTAHGMQYSMDDKEMYQDMVNIFVEQQSENEGFIKDTLAKQDWENYRIRVHGLKSNSRLVGGMELGDLAEKCEHAARNGDTAFIEANTAPLLDLYAQTVEALKAIDFGAL